MKNFSSIHPSDLEAGNSDEDKCTNVTAIVCAVCCGAAFFTIVLTAYITGIVGLAHTRNATLDPMCPPWYWHASLGMLLARICFAVFLCLINCCIQCCYDRPKAVAMCTTLIWLCFHFSMTISNTTITAAAIKAPNCTEAVRGTTDSSALLMDSGSIFIFVDWVCLILLCVRCCQKFEEMEEE